MLNALSQSPITAQQFYEWDTKLQNDEILVREIIDIDTNYMEDETNNASPKQKRSDEDDKKNKLDENNNEGGEDICSIKPSLITAIFVAIVRASN